MPKPTYEELQAAFQEAYTHLDYCGFGDMWERECARDSGLIARLTAVNLALLEPAAPARTEDPADRVLAWAGPSARADLARRGAK